MTTTPNGSDCDVLIIGGGLADNVARLETLAAGVQSMVAGSLAGQMVLDESDFPR